MTTARQTYTNAIAAANAAKAATLQANEQTRQASVAGGTSAVAAGKARVLADIAAEQTYQSALMVARDALRSAGNDNNSF
jgi:hypothetical protein